MNGASEFGAQEYGSARRSLERSGLGTSTRAVMGDGFDGLNQRNNERTFRSSYDDGRDYDFNTPRDQYETSGRLSNDRDFTLTRGRGSLLPPKPSDSVSRIHTSSYDSGRYTFERKCFNIN